MKYINKMADPAPVEKKSNWMALGGTIAGIIFVVLILMYIANKIGLSNFIRIF